MSFQTCVIFFFLWKTKEDNLRNVPDLFVPYNEVNGKVNCQNGLVTNILQNIYFCVLQKKIIQVWNDIRVSK